MFPKYLQMKKEENGNDTFTLRRATTPVTVPSTNKSVLSNKWIWIWSTWLITTVSYHFIIVIFLLANLIVPICDFSRWCTQYLLKNEKNKNKKRTWKAKGKEKMKITLVKSYELSSINSLTHDFYKLTIDPISIYKKVSVRNVLYQIQTINIDMNF